MALIMAPEYTPEEERDRLSNLQRQYSQINSGGFNPDFNDLSSRLAAGIGRANTNIAFGPLGFLVPNLATSPEAGILTRLLTQQKPDNKVSGSNMGRTAYEYPIGPGIGPKGEKWLTQGFPSYEAYLAAQPAPQIPEDPYLSALYSILGQNTADTSGYDAALTDINKQRTQSKKRYQTYSAQISDLFGNLGRKSATYAQDQAGIRQQSEITRSQLAAQQAQQVNQTRSADASRLQAATEARAALGLGESASAGAAGDIATLRGEQGITDQQAMGQTTMDTILANEALAKLVSSRQAGGFDMAGQQAQAELNMSYEDLLASLSSAEAQTKMQRSQAVSAGAMSPSEQVAILQAAENYKNEKAKAPTVDSPEAAITIWKKANPNSADRVDALLGAFIPWITTEAPNTIEGKEPTFLQLVNAFTDNEDNAAAVEILNSDPALLSALQTYLNIK